MAIGLALGIQAVVVKPFQIPSASMVPLLSVNERVLVNRLAYTVGGDPSIGDVVVFHPPDGATNNGKDCGVQRKARQPCPEGTDEPSDENFIKRIVAGPGDELYIEDGHPVVNGEMAEEDFVKPCSNGSSDCNLTDPITIPPDHYFMMGDNRANSLDSRFWGPVPEDWIIGKAFFSYWPPSEIGPF